ncbi:MAG: dihydropteroate synthase [Bacteroidales bacterium]|nr:dihydropteroate synthase [Bacteroidales bacterium]
MVQWMGIINLTPDSFFEPSRAGSVGEFMAKVEGFAAAGATYIDVGAVSTRPGAAAVSVDEEWRRLEPALRQLVASGLCAPRALRLSIDTTSSEIVRRTFDLVGPFIVNDISAGEDDVLMLPVTARLGLSYVAMHKRGTPSTMDSFCTYPGGVVPELLRYFGGFASRARALGLDDWILDPGLGFAKTPQQCWEILEQLPALNVLGRPILIGAADKRFTREVPSHLAAAYPGLDGNCIAEALAEAGGASILRVHEIRKCHD